METRKCSKCKKTKTVLEFRIRTRKTMVSYQSYCKLCQKNSAHRHYKENKAHHSQTRYKREESIRLWIYDVLTKSKCADCPESDPVILEFDHVRGDKKFNISNYHSHGIGKVKEEIDKCQIVCANCHRRRTAKRGNWKKFIGV